MVDTANLDIEQERARRIGQHLHDQQSKKALADYILELEAEKIRASLSRPPSIRRRR